MEVYVSQMEEREKGSVEEGGRNTDVREWPIAKEMLVV